MRKNGWSKIVILCFSWMCLLFSEPVRTNSGDEATPPEVRIKSWEHHVRLRNDSLFKNMMWRPAGPFFQGGRISCVVCPSGNSSTVYVGVGSGNVWKTTNNGITWKPIFENESTFAVGDIEVSKSNPDIVWVGSGEEYQARSGYAGTGVFKSTNAGESWKNMGLVDTQHIGRIVIDPKDPDIVYVAAIGHNYTFNEERGLFKTTDGGKTWEKVLYVSEKAGAIDVVIDPADRKILYAAFWERDRKAWNVVENGEGSGLYKTTDAGKTWKRLTKGFPVGEFVGRIGLDVSPSNPDVVYALLDSQAPLSEAPRRARGEQPDLTFSQLEKMTEKDFLGLETRRLGQFLNEIRVPRVYTAEIIKGWIRKGEIDIKELKGHLRGYRERRQRRRGPPVVGAEVYRSDDKGETWRKVNATDLTFFYNTYGYYFGDIRVSPDDEDEIYILGVRFLTSKDGGKTYREVNGKVVHFYHHEGTGIHLDHHDLWIDPSNTDRLLLANDGGLFFSYDRGTTWLHVNNLPICEFYDIALDLDTPYKIYGGTQDVASVYGPSDYDPQDDPDDPWKHIWLDPWTGGDGAYTLPDPKDFNKVIYYERGNIIEKNLIDGSRRIYARPQAEFGEPPLRWRMGRAPFLISRYNPDVLYYGANKLFKTSDRGRGWVCISPDLTTAPGPDRQGNHTYGTITSISESPLKAGLIYVGTDDGNIQVTRNDGEAWSLINTGPPHKIVSCVTTSRYEEGTVYASLSGYFQDDFEKYLYKSTDFGGTWTSIAGNLPSESINVIREDPENPNVLYIGTDLGVYVSIDRGESWHSLCRTLPTCVALDMDVHPREKELVVGTHGRSVFILDVSSIQAFTKDVQKKEAHLFESKPAVLPKVSGGRYSHAGKRQGPQARVTYYLKSPQQVEIRIVDESGKVVKELQGTGDRGFNTASWDLTRHREGEGAAEYAPQKNFVDPGMYRVEIRGGPIKLEGKIQVKRPRMSVLSY